MSIETVEIRAFSGPSVVEINGSDQPAIVEINQGPAGAAGPNSVTSATTSDGTANLSLSNVTTATAEVTGTLTANHIHGNLAGSVYAHVRAGENLAKGDPVYVSGSHGTGANLIPIVSKADSSNSTKMPAIGIVDAAIANNATGHMVITGQITDINTAAYAINQELYVAEGGGITGTAPYDLAQPIGRVERSNTNNGSIIVKVNGLSAITQTPETLVRRDAAGTVEAYSLRVHTNPFYGFTTTVEAENDGSLEPAVVLTLPLKSGYLATTGNSNGVVNIANGGTNATTASSARTNLGIGTTDAPTFANISLASGTITTSQPLSLTQTWNAAGVTFKGIDVNVTDTASASASLLMDLRVGGVSRTRILKTGSISIEGTLTFKGAKISGGPHSGTQSFLLLNEFYWSIGRGSSPTIKSSDEGIACALNAFGLTSNTSEIGGSADVILNRDAANTLAQRNGTNAQVTRIYDTYTSATDYHRLAIATARATATAMSGATVTLTNIIPKGAVVVGVTCKVTTAITGATSFDIGTAADPDRFGAGIGVALATTSDNTNWTAGGIECFTAATSIILTANGGNFTAGAVYVSVQYLSGQAD